MARVLAALAVLLALAPGVAGAHAVLIETRPESVRRLDQPPAELVLRFNEPVTPVTVRLLDAAGAEIPVEVTADGETLTVRPAARLAQGAYLLSYRVTSIDAHPVGATLRFAVGVEPAPEAAEGEPAPGLAGVVARWLTYLTALGSAGLALFLALVRPPQPLAERTRRLMAGLALAGIGVLALRLGSTGFELAGLPPEALLTALPWRAVAGTSLALASGVTALGLVLLVAGGRRRAFQLTGALTIVAGFALTGHATTASPRWLTGPALALHAACAAFWLGSLLPLLWCLRLPAGDAHAVLRRFSTIAVGALGLLVLAGTVLSWVQLGGQLAPLWETAYGLRLTIKLALVAGLVALAVVNRYLLTPRILRDDPTAHRRLGRTLGLDLALGLAVLAVTTSFPLSPPPRAALPAGDGVTIVAASQGRQAIITLLPGRPGANRLEAWVTDAAGRPVVAREAGLRWRAAGIEPLRAQAGAARPGLFVARDLVLPRAGPWQLRLDLLIDDFTKLTFEGEVTVR